MVEVTRPSGKWWIQAVLIHGQSGRVVGSAPVSWVKILLLVRKDSGLTKVTQLKGKKLSLSDDAPINMWAGIACYPAHGMDTEELLAQADDALERAEQ